MPLSFFFFVHVLLFPERKNTSQNKKKEYIEYSIKYLCIYKNAFLFIIDILYIHIYYTYIKGREKRIIYCLNTE